MSESMMIFIIGTVFSILSAIFWKWNSSLSKANEKTIEKIDHLSEQMTNFKEEVYKSYQTNVSATYAQEQIIKRLDEIVTDIKQLSEELHKRD